MKTVVWDNGLEYSDHAIHFFDVEDDHVDDLVAALNTKYGDAEYEKGFVVGVGNVDWWKGGSSELSDVFGVLDVLPDWLMLRVCRERMRYQEGRIVCCEARMSRYDKGNIANAKSIIQECGSRIAVIKSRMQQEQQHCLCGSEQHCSLCDPQNAPPHGASVPSNG